MFESKGWRVAPFIFVTVMLENMALISIGINLFTYVFNKMHFSLTSSANIVTNFMGTSFLTSLAGGIVSDAWLSRFTTIVIAGLLEVTGLLLLTLSAAMPSLRPPECQLLSSACQEATSPQKAVLFGGLYLLAVGSGAIKANLAPLGAEHFDDRDPEEKKQLGTYFNAYFLSMCLGGLCALTAMVYIQANISFKVGYGISLGGMLLALIVALAGYPLYQDKKYDSGGSPLISFAQVCFASIWNRKLPALDPEMLHEDEGGKAYRIQHTNQFKFLDKAATVDSYSLPFKSQAKKSPWTLCTVTQVEEVKIILRILPIFASTIVLNCMVGQLQTFSVQQGQTMNRKVAKHFEIPPASLAVLPVVFMIIMLPIYDRIFVPFTRRFTGHENGITYLQRISVGLVLATLSMVVAALVETKRLNVAKEHGLLDNATATVPIRIYWLMLQYFIFGLADMFTFVGLMEFFYRESPERLRSMSTSLTFVSLALGYFLSSALVSIVKSATTRNGKLGWLPNNINRGKLTNFYWLLAVINAVNFLNYLFWAKCYKYRNAFDASAYSSSSASPAKTKADGDGEKNVESGPRLSIEGVGSVSARPLIKKSVDIA